MIRYLTLFLLGGMIACTGPSYLDKRQFSDACWSMQDTLRATMDLAPTPGSSLLIGLEFGANYRYENLYLKMRYRQGAGEWKEEVLNERLIDPAGNWLRERQGDRVAWTITQPLIVEQAGTYELEVWHYMRDSSLCDVHMVGLDCEPMQCELICVEWEGAKDLSPLMTCLSDAEHQQYQRFRAEAARREFLVGRSLLRLMAGQRLQLPPAEVPLLHSPQGKPSLVGNPFHLNLSHTRGVVLLALCDSHPVGIDIERGDRSVRPQVADRFFSAVERAELAAMSPPVQTTSFLRLWTLKEAWWKAYDPPYEWDMRQLSTHWDPLSLRDREGKAHGSLAQGQRGPYLYALAISCDQVTPVINWQDLPLADLLQMS